MSLLAEAIAFAQLREILWRDEPIKTKEKADENNNEIIDRKLLDAGFEPGEHGANSI